MSDRHPARRASPRSYSARRSTRLPSNSSPPVKSIRSSSVPPPAGSLPRSLPPGDVRLPAEDAGSGAAAAGELGRLRKGRRRRTPSLLSASSRRRAARRAVSSGRTGEPRRREPRRVHHRRTGRRPALQAPGARPPRRPGARPGRSGRGGCAGRGAAGSCPSIRAGRSCRVPRNVLPVPKRSAVPPDEATPTPPRVRGLGREDALSERPDRRSRSSLAHSHRRHGNEAAHALSRTFE